MSYKPIAPNKYNKPQLILSSGRILFNAYDDSVLFFSDKSIGFSTNGTINIDSRDKTIINSPQIQLGLKADEPLLLGNKSVTLLESLILNLKELSSSLTLLVALPAGSPYIDINQKAANLTIILEQLHNDLPNIKSKQNFTK